MDFGKNGFFRSEFGEIVFSKIIIFWHVFCGNLCGKKFVLPNTVFTMKTKIEHGKGILDLIQSS